ncbi:SAM-dependent methyltransferase [Neobacillus dielmonensis]|uniref:SAM-dependent methyltransferase n=1 Tax=Neobacillus dielmonensis TaxID=1347369 RepID=UPI0005A8C46C|nr:methyltransferase domain-containing protein [Neobacillus dielmonensis]
MKEHYYDKLLNIKTRDEQQGFHKSLHNHRYEPTPYSGLEELFRHFQLNSNDRVVDFGCGKGRLNFYIHYFFHATVIGIEMSEELLERALANQTSYLKKTKNRADKLHFLNCLAQDYPINPQDNCFYFFNPFSVQVFQKVMNNILVSVEQYPRDISLILYYPSEDYIYHLESYTAFDCEKEIQVPYMYQHNPNERFLIYRLKS